MESKVPIRTHSTLPNIQEEHKENDTASQDTTSRYQGQGGAQSPTLEVPKSQTQSQSQDRDVYVNTSTHTHALSIWNDCPFGRHGRILALIAVIFGSHSGIVWCQKLADGKVKDV